ncbi:hypothetical protein IAT38_007099 [Cryptococcus sp. DSM 104549]
MLGRPALRPSRLPPRRPAVPLPAALAAHAAHARRESLTTTSAYASASTSASAPGFASGQNSEGVPFSEWSVRSPKDLYTYLSQYIVGQDRAKRILSVAVFNHYHRITPRLPPPSSSPSSSATASSAPSRSRPLPPPIDLDSPIPAPPSPTRSRGTSNRTSAALAQQAASASPEKAALSSSGRWDPSREVGWFGDASTVTGAEGADPTLTHDLLTLRSREGQWARDGYFHTRPPPPLPSLLGEALKRRRPSGPSNYGATPEFPSSMDFDTPLLRGRQRRAELMASAEASEEAYRREAEVRARKERREATRRALNKGEVEEEIRKEGERESVVIEKSNVLMVGPTGTGKTLMARTLAKVLDVPFVSCDATTYTQAGSSNYNVDKTQVGIIHIDEIDKLARRGGGEMGSWGGGRDVGGEGVQQALLRLLEGTTLTLSAKAPAITSSGGSSSASSPTSSGGQFSPGSGGSGTRAERESVAGYGDPPGWDPNNPMNRGLGGKRSVREGLPGFSGGGSPANKGDTYTVDTSNILFILSGAFVGLDTIVNRRLGKGSIGFGAPLPKPLVTESTNPNPIPLKGLATTDLATYGLIPEFLGRLPILSTLHPLSVDDLVRILVEPRNALIKQYMAMFEKYGSELRFTEKAIKEVAREGLERGGGARGLRGVLEEVLVDSMFEVPGSSVRYCLVTEAVVRKEEPALYFSRGQRMAYLQAVEDEDGGQIVEEAYMEPERMAATG